MSIFDYALFGDFFIAGGSGLYGSFFWGFLYDYRDSLVFYLQGCSYFCIYFYSLFRYIGGSRSWGNSFRVTILVSGVGFLSVVYTIFVVAPRTLCFGRLGNEV